MEEFNLSTYSLHFFSYKGFLTLEKVCLVVVIAAQYHHTSNIYIHFSAKVFVPHEIKLLN